VTRDAAPADRIRAGALVGLAVSSLALTILAVVQWRELLHTLKGGTAFCSINDVLNCATVWESAFAKTIHRLTRVPIAGWGFSWGVAALSSAVLLGLRMKRSQPLGRAHGAVLATAAAGIMASLVLFAVSLRMATFCITCIGTYVLAAVYAGCAFAVRPRRALARGDLLRGAALAAAFTVSAWIVVLYPGLETPIDRPKQLPTAAGQIGQDALASFLNGLPGEVQQSVSDAFELYQRSPVPDVSRFGAGAMSGASTAPVKLVEFFDIRCVHCKHFAEVLHEIEGNVPEGLLAIDLHLFPLDASCNPTIAKEMTDETGVRCAAARSLLCLAGPRGSAGAGDAGAFREAQERMFAEQGALKLDRVYAIATEVGKMARADLDACMQSMQTASRLKQDIEYAMAYEIEGTPLVVVNGRRAIGIAPFLYALILARGDLRAPGWQVLPKPQADASR
jgi:protein-disulfide isomerase/uncharacterized membrane protein